MSVFMSLLFSCSDNPNIINGNESGNQGDGNSDGSINLTEAEYLKMVDPPKNEGQYWLPEFKISPKAYYVCTTDGFSYEINKTNPLEGLQYANMCESLAGLVNRGVERGEIEEAIWLDGGNSRSYQLCEQDLMATGAIRKTKADGITLLKTGAFASIVKGFILTDVVKNPESSSVAAVASHVYNAIIVDVRDQSLYEDLGLKMLYDATKKTVKDSWNEFKDKCNNSALVVMGAHTNELKDLAIANNLFMMNLYDGAQFHWDILDEVLDWLKPISPVYGCWDNTDEHTFVQPVSQKGHVAVVSNYLMNTPLTSLNYSQRQVDLQANVLEPQKIDYSTNDRDKYISYYLSDGDNVQWIFHIWYDGWFKHPQASDVKMSFGIPSTNLDMMAPAVYRNIVNNQSPENTLVENCGGGYVYIDAFASNKETDRYLKDLAKKVSANMRQHRLKVLGLFTNYATSDVAKNAYKAFIEANNWLEGIIVVQYAPYNGGHGEVYWFKNSDGVEIPVITVRYSIWNFGEKNSQGQGTPAYIASKIKEERPDFSLIDVHCWSTFTDIGLSNDPVAESAPGGNVSGAGAAAMCQRRLPQNYKCVSLQEFIWRMRMKHNKEQTEAVLKSYK